MDPIQALTACDTVRIGLLLANVSDSEGYIPSGPKWITGICIAKVRGKLVLNLDLSALAAGFGFPTQPGIIVALQGTLDGADSMGQPVVKWTVNAQIGQQIDDVTIESVTGSFRTSVTRHQPAERTTACGQERTYVIQLDGIGAPNDSLTVKVSKDFATIPHHDTITIKNIALKAAAGLQVDVSVQIRPRGPTLCPPLLNIEGQERTYRAWISGAQGGLIESYTWTVTGATAIGPLSSWELKVKLPSPPQLVTISVEVTAAGVPALHHIQFTPMDTAAAQYLESMLQLLCRLRGEVIRNEFFNPLSDPLRDPIRELVRPNELTSLAASASRLANIAQELAGAIGTARRIEN